VPSDISWGTGSTLIVDAGAFPGVGALNITRTAGTITVADNASTLQINSGATVNLGGSVDALHDSVSGNNVNVVNNSVSSFNVTSGTKNIGNLSGVGTNNISNGATLVVNESAGTTGGVVQGSGTLVKAGSATLRVTRLGSSATPLGALNITAGHLELGNVTTGGQSTVNTSVLSSAPTITGGGQLDMGDHAMIVNYGAETTNATRNTIRNLLINGRNAGPGSPAPWNGNNGITSSFAHTNGNGFNLAIGYADNAQLAAISAAGSYTSFGGQTVGSTTILVQMTRGADANLDGKVDGQDVSIIGTHFNKPGSGQWYFGDFDYSGSCDGNDVSVLGTTFGKTSPTLSPAQLAAEFGSAFADAFEAGQASGAVPEPASLTLIGLGGIALLGRRRRRLNVSP
jgi:hypothetical protein